MMSFYDNKYILLNQTNFDDPFILFYIFEESNFKRNVM